MGSQEGAWKGNTSNQELAWVGPGGAVEALDGNPALGVELALIDDVGRLVAVFGDDILGGEAGGGEAQLLEGELLEGRQVARVPRLLPLSSVGLEVHTIGIGIAAAAAQQPRRPHAHSFSYQELLTRLSRAGSIACWD